MSAIGGKEAFIHVLRSFRSCLGALLAAAVILCPSAGLAITASTLTYGGASPGKSYSTVSITPAANTLLLAWVTNTMNTSLDTPTLASNGLNWVQVGTVTWDTVSSPSTRTTLFRAMGASPGSGPVSIGFATNQANCEWVIVQFSQVEPSGSDGSGAIAQYVTGRQDSTKPFAIYLGTLGKPANASAGGFSNGLTSPDAMSPGTGYVASPMAQVSNSTLMAEWTMPRVVTVDVSAKTPIHFGGIAVEIVAATTTLGSGTDPGSTTIPPGGPATMVDAFTFQTNNGTATISNITVTLSAGSYSGMSLVEITDASGSTVYGSVSNPGSDTVSIPLSTSITAGTSLSSYKIRITPKSHASMPVPPGSLYAVTAFVSDWIDANNHAGADSGGATVTIDNLSPANVTAAGASAGDAVVLLGWTNPADSDLASVVVLRKAGSAVTDAPVEGQGYVAGATIGASTVACVVASPGGTCNDTGVVNGTTYYYRIFAKDATGNYSATGVAAGPAMPQHYQPDAMIKLASEADTAYLSASVYEATAATQVKSQGVGSGATASYKVRFQNNGSGADSLLVTGTGSGSNYTVQYLDASSVDRTAAVTGAGYTISGLAASAYQDWTVNVTPSGGATPAQGGSSYQVLATATSASDASKLDQVKAVTVSISAHLTLLKSADKGAYKPGEDITYTTVASNGASLSNASSVAVTDPIPDNTGFKVSGATFDAGSSTLAGAVSYSNGSFGYTPVSGGCGAPAGYDYCVTQVKWNTTGSMPPGSSFAIFLVVRVK